MSSYLYIPLISVLTIGCATVESPDKMDLEDTIDGETTPSDSTTEEDAYSIPNYAEGVSTLAGSGEFSSKDGIGTDAAFAEPKAIRMHSNGTLFVADSLTGAIREVSLDGTVQTLNVTGVAPVAPSGIAIDEENNAIYVSDFDQHCILKIQNGYSSVFAGSCGTKGFANGDSALFDHPRGLALDFDGNLLVADSHNNLIRSISESGEVTNFAGSGELFVGPSTGSLEEANIYLPFAVAVHSSGDVFFTGFDHCVRRIHQGEVENIAGLCRNYGNTGRDDGQAEDARFDTPLDIVFTADEDLLIADVFNDRIRMLSNDFTTVSTVAGSYAGFADGAVDQAMFDAPRALTIDYKGNIYVADSVNHRIRVIAAE